MNSRRRSSRSLRGRLPIVLALPTIFFSYAAGAKLQAAPAAAPPAPPAAAPVLPTPPAVASPSPSRNWGTTGPYGGEVLCLAGNGGGVLYAGTSQGAFVSRDWGQTWTLRSDGLAGLSMQDLALDPAGNAFAATSGGLYRKAFDSLVWKPTGPPDFYLSVATDSTGGVFAGSFHHGLVISLDHGRTWLDRPPAPPALAVYKLAVDSGGRVYAGTVSGVYVTRDAGVNWSREELGPGEAVTGITTGWSAGDTSAAGPAPNIFAGTSRGHVFVSRDRGETWQLLTPAALSSPVSGVVAGPNGAVFAANHDGFWQFDPTTGTWILDGTGYSGGHVNATLSINGRIFLATAGGVQTRAGQAWVPENQGLWAHSIKAVAAGPAGFVVSASHDGLYRSLDHGATWIYSGEPEAHVSSVGVAPDGTVYVSLLSNGHPTGILHSTDKGLSWHVAGDGLPDGSVFSVAAGDHGSVYAGTQSGLYLSNDGGNTWRESDDGMGPEALHSVVVAEDGSILACSRDGIYRSVDRGAHWQAVNDGLLSSHAEYLAAGAGGSVFASSGPRIYRMVTHGAGADQTISWELRSEAPDGVGPMELVSAPDGVVYASDLQSGVWVSQDGAAHWKSLDTGLYTPYILSLSLSSDGHLYAGTNGASVWQIAVAPLPTAQPAASSSSTPERLAANSPGNPKSPLTGR